MLRSNLATRPFYNERLVHLLIGVLAVLVVVVTAYNVQQVASLSTRQAEAAARASSDEQQARLLRQQANAARATLRDDELRRVAADALEANALIDRRLFSWTQLFNHVERTLPADVMLLAVRPAVDRDVVRVGMVVLGRRIADIDEFIRQLEGTGAFKDMLSTQEQVEDDGTFRSTVEGRYVQAAGSPGGAP
jgi:hypothetical protein